MPRGQVVPVTPSVLQWAVNESGYPVDDLAEAVGVPPETVKAWSTGERQPKLTQLRTLAAKLKRPLAAFLLPEPPRSPIPTVEFRGPPGSKRRALNPEERRRLREAARLQRVLSWIGRELQRGPVGLPRVGTNADPEQTAAETRNRLAATRQQREQWASSSAALQGWRAALEDSGVSVFMLPLGKDSCRGFSLWDEQAPLIGVNTWWNAEARIFTLFHEYGHLLTRTNSACLEGTYRRTSSHSDTTERWCEQFAAAVILPQQDLRDYLVSRGWDHRRAITDLESVRLIARHFKVSLRATTLRLIELGAATWDLYASLPPLADRKPEGGGGAGRTRGQVKRDQYGSRTVELFATALERDVLSRGDILDYLDVPPLALSEVRSPGQSSDEHD